MMGFVPQPILLLLLPLIYVDNLSLFKKSEIFLLKYNGLYTCKLAEDLNAYIRFYKNGIVLAASSTGNPEQTIRWLNCSNSFISKGAYEISAPNIRFSTTSSCGTVYYNGHIDEEFLLLNEHSFINGYKTTRTYLFIELAEIIGIENNIEPNNEYEIRHIGRG